MLDYSPYVAIFLLLTIGIWLIPFAEEAALAGAGYLYYSGEVQLAPVLITAITGVFLGDYLAFWLGQLWRSGRLRLSSTFFGSHQWISKVNVFLQRYSTHALFWARFLPGIRLPAHTLVGAHGMAVARYVRISALSVLIYVPLIFLVAYSFGEEMQTALRGLQSLETAAWSVFLSTIVFWLVLRVWTSRSSLLDAGR